MDYCFKKRVHLLQFSMYSKPEKKIVGLTLKSKLPVFVHNIFFNFKLIH